MSFVYICPNTRCGQILNTRFEENEYYFVCFHCNLKQKRESIIHKVVKVRSYFKKEDSDSESINGSESD